MPDALKPPTERIPLQSWVRTPRIVRAEFTSLLQELAEVKQRLEKAEEQLRRNSQNSSQPPSQDRPGHEPVREDDLSAKKRRRGGQKGHPGHQRPLVPIDQVDDVVVHRPIACAACRALLLGEDPVPYRYQVAELPVLKARITEHQVQTVMCPCCGAKNRGTLPDGVAASQFGPNLTSLMALLMA